MSAPHLFDVDEEGGAEASGVVLRLVDWTPAHCARLREVSHQQRQHQQQQQTPRAKPPTNDDDYNDDIYIEKDNDCRWLLSAPVWIQGLFLVGFVLVVASAAFLLVYCFWEETYAPASSSPAELWFPRTPTPTPSCPHCHDLPERPISTPPTSAPTAMSRTAAPTTSRPTVAPPPRATAFPTFAVPSNETRKA
jgi:hypothetical protein